MKTKSKSRKSVLLLAASLAFCGALAAQSAPPPPPGGGPGPGFGRMGGPDDGIRFLGFESGFGEKKVTGAPFSASFSTTTTQTLSDGNKIDRTSTGTVARDSQGRTRRDMTLPPGPWSDADKVAPHVVFINDPVAGANYVLKVTEKTGMRFTPQADGHGPEGQGRHGGPDADDRQDKDVVTTSLGTQTINGVSAEGTKTTRTIPAGAIGNQNPIQITVERWYAPSLQLYVMVKRSDPRSGDSIFQLTGVQTSEPPASSFQVPSDYTITAGGEGHGPRGSHHGAPPPPAAPQQ